MWKVRGRVFMLGLAVTFTGLFAFDGPVADPDSLKAVATTKKLAAKQVELAARYSALHQDFSRFPHSPDKLTEIESAGSAWFFRNCVTWSVARGRLPDYYTEQESVALLFQGGGSLNMGFFLNPKEDAAGLIKMKDDIQFNFRRGNENACDYGGPLDYYSRTNTVVVKVDPTGRKGMLQRESTGDGKIADFHMYTVCHSEKMEQK